MNETSLNPEDEKDVKLTLAAKGFVEALLNCGASGCGISVFKEDGVEYKAIVQRLYRSSDGTVKQADEAPETCISESKRWRRDLDSILQEMKGYNSLVYSDASTMSLDEREARCAARSRLSESIMWCGMILKSLGTPNPYPNSYNPSNTIVDPTADGLKL